MLCEAYESPVLNNITWSQLHRHFTFEMKHDRHYAPESDVYRRQILTYKDGPRTEWAELSVRTWNVVLWLQCDLMSVMWTVYASKSTWNQSMMNSKDHVKKTATHNLIFNSGYLNLSRYCQMSRKRRISNHSTPSASLGRAYFRFRISFRRDNAT